MHHMWRVPGQHHMLQGEFGAGLVPIGNSTQGHSKVHFASFTQSWPGVHAAATIGAGPRHTLPSELRDDRGCDALWAGLGPQ